MKESRISTQISSDFMVELSEQPDLLLYDNYGWAEEGGYNSLLQLSQNDCNKIAQKIDSTKNIHSNSTYFEYFQKQEINLQNVLYKWFEDDYLDYREYALDPTSCTLFLQYHFE